MDINISAKEMREVAEEKYKEIQKRNSECAKRQLMSKISTAAQLGLFKCEIVLLKDNIKFVEPEEIISFLINLGYNANYHISKRFPCEDLVFNISWE